MKRHGCRVTRMRPNFPFVVNLSNHERKILMTY
jgi:hypothetical protein